MAEIAPPRLKQLGIGSLKDLPVVRQLALLIGLALAVAGGVALFTWSQQPNFVPVYPGLAEKDSAEVAEALRAAGTPFRLDPVSGTVTVPGDKVYEARMHLASQGLPKGTATGFEMIQQDQGLGTSQFIENARYQMALETELARTVSSLQPVKSARVHLALPKASAFVRHQDSASASVVVELYPGRQLEQGQVSSIVHIVASSVPDLVPGAVSVIDQYGHLLTQADPDSESAQSAVQFEQTHRLEADYIHRIEQLLTPMLGPGRVSAQVAADMDFSVTEEARETYKPDPSAVRSEQTSEDTTRNGGSSSAQGIPGATSNQPPPTASAANAANAKSAAAAPAAAAPAADTTISQNRTSTRNYELDRTVSHTRQAVGRIHRLSVAVLVDNIQKVDAKSGKKTLVPLSQDELAKVEALVKEAVGFDASRGDTVAVQNAPFAASENVPALAPVPLWQKPEVRDIARQGLGAVVLLVLVLAVLRPLLRNLMATPIRMAGGGMVEGQLGEDQLSLGGGGARGAMQAIPYEQKLAAARGAVTQDPKRVAQVVKTWLGEDG
ncbi:MAG: flagellar basal-body MS-ring/collar protein FliF [Nevskia sp.]|nr:flagellar basal-body MS-ring/collar protein FliF [Nevskia sp.]